MIAQSGSPALMAGMITALCVTPATAAVTISTAATANMNCVSGVCTPTAADAVLNVGDLTTLLASGNVKLAAAGEPVDVDIAAPLSWVSTNTLTLDSYHSINVQQPVAITGGGGLAVITNDGGTGGEFAFAPATNVAIWSLSSSLSINGTTYTLVDDIATLASDVTANPNGSYALAGNYNAAPDGTYSASPIATAFSGNFQGLGNTISNLIIVNDAKVALIGLFARANTSATIANVVLQNVAITATGASANVGGVTGSNQGTLFDDHVSGSVTGAVVSPVGGLAGYNTGTVVDSSASASVYGSSGQEGGEVGGLLGFNNGGAVNGSFASGTITGRARGSAYLAIGGLVGYNEAGTISNSYATGPVDGGGKLLAGGLVGLFQGGTISSSYSVGRAKGGKQAYAGGFIGFFAVGGTDTNSYWDKTTSGRADAAGNDKDLGGVKGLTSNRLQRGVPVGFDPTIWAESLSINNGFPYLTANPPQ